MNYQTAAVVAATAFLLSFLAGLLGGVPIFDAVLRAFFWAAFGFGGSLGVEALLKALVPDLFSAEETTPDPGVVPERTVDITVDDDGPGIRKEFVEEVDEDPIPQVVRTSTAGSPQPAVSSTEPPAAVVEVPESIPRNPVLEPGASSEEMPEIGSFLEAFKPDGSEEEESEDEGADVRASPAYGEYTPMEMDRPAAGAVTIDGEEQDPVILAKAIQTVMKRDAQGN